MEMIRNGVSKELLTEDIVLMCISVNLTTERVCRGVVNLNIDQIMFIVKNRPSLTAKQLCGMVLQDYHCFPDSLIPNFDFSVNVDENKPQLGESKDTSVPPSANDLTIAHITDPHYDPRYQVGSIVECKEPSCCRNDQPMSNDSSVSAQRWGDYRMCDSPLEAVEDAFMQIRRQHQVCFTLEIFNSI